MRSPHLLSALLLSTVFLSAGCSKSEPGAASNVSSSEAEKTAQGVAETWLAIVDAGKYDDSWDQAAKLFKGAVDKGGWNKQIAGVRGPLGALGKRALSSAKYTKTAPGAPDGQYVILQFNTSFANKSSAVETVTPMLDPDGTWRVSGYFIR